MTRRTSTKKRRQSSSSSSSSSSSKSYLAWMRRSVEFKSLEDVWYTLLSVCLQFVCIWRAFERIRKYANETWEPFERPVVQLGVYVVCAVMSVCLLPVMIWSGLVRVGTYANDRFRFGHDLDTKRIGKRELTSKGLRRCSEISVSQHQPRSIAAGYWPNIKTLTSLTVPICRKVMPTPACPSDA